MTTIHELIGSGISIFQQIVNLFRGDWSDGDGGDGCHGLFG